MYLISLLLCIFLRTAIKKKEIGCQARHLKYISILQEFCGDIKRFRYNQNRAFHNETVSK